MCCPIFSDLGRPIVLIGLSVWPFFPSEERPVCSQAAALLHMGHACFLHLYDDADKANDEGDE